MVMFVLSSLKQVVIQMLTSTPSFLLLLNYHIAMASHIIEIKFANTFHPSFIGNLCKINLIL